MILKINDSRITLSSFPKIIYDASIEKWLDFKLETEFNEEVIELLTNNIEMFELVNGVDKYKVVPIFVRYKINKGVVIITTTPLYCEYIG